MDLAIVLSCISLGLTTVGVAVIVVFAYMIKRHGKPLHEQSEEKRLGNEERRLKLHLSWANLDDEEKFHQAKLQRLAAENYAIRQIALETIDSQIDAAKALALQERQESQEQARRLQEISHLASTYAVVARHDKQMSFVEYVNIIATTGLISLDLDQEEFA